MNYQALARKWRPKTFCDVVGQEHVLTILKNSLSLGRVHHAYLFSGTRGVGKTSIARLLVKGLNCETGITSVLCNTCNNCLEIEQGRFIDLIEVDAASRTKVEDTRDILDNVQYSPVRGRFKIYLIDEVHMLSRHSFNALLKTLEEPPPHVKFLLATTDQQKLPITVLSRCLQFHLKALDTEQIFNQLKHILNKEKIVYDFHSLQLLARAANGSLRDALSLTDQAIANGNGKLSEESVRAMLRTFGDDQALSLIEMIIAADSERVMMLVNEAASRGVEWEMLLIEMQSLLHRIAMIQFSSFTFTSTEMQASFEYRMHELARTVSPTNIQLYYQILLIGRKELPYAPDRRMGVEMTLLRALAFHPKLSLDNMEMPSCSFSPASLNTEPTTRQSNDITSNATNQASTLCKELKRVKKVQQIQKGAIQPKKNASTEKFRCLTSVTEQTQSQSALYSLLKEKNVKETYHQKIHSVPQQIDIEATTPRVLKKNTECCDEKMSLIVSKLINEASKRDVWSEEISKLKLPKSVEQVALNSWKEQNGSKVCLHVRLEQHNFNLSDTRKILAESLAALQGIPIELTIINDSDLSIRTPLEWRQAIYKEKFTRAYEVLITDRNIQALRYLFDAELDKKSICLL